MKKFLFLFTFILTFISFAQRPQLDYLSVKELYSSGSVMTISTDSIHTSGTLYGSSFNFIRTTSSQDSITSKPIQTNGSGEFNIDVTVYSSTHSSPSLIIYLGKYRGKGLLNADSDGYIWENIKTITSTDTSLSYQYTATTSNTRDFFNRYKVRVSEQSSVKNEIVVWVRHVKVK